jgi:tRNA dimethylallyltransferase
VRHHILDVIEPGEHFTVARYQHLARESIAEIRGAGRVPMIVGGSGLYFRGAVDDLRFPPTDPVIRAALEREDLETLAARLKIEDPEAATFIDLANRRRMVRALEVIQITGRPFSSFRDRWGRFQTAIVAGLEVDDAELDRRIRARLESMLERGLLDEVRTLIDAGARDALTKTQAIAYREAVEVVEGRLSKEDLIERAARATKRLARRQMSWFRRDPRVRWFDATDTERAGAEVGAYYTERLEEG